MCSIEKSGQESILSALVHVDRLFCVVVVMIRNFRMVVGMTGNILAVDMGVRMHMAVLVGMEQIAMAMGMGVDVLVVVGVL